MSDDSKLVEIDGFNFYPMPKRFMVWNKIAQDFVSGDGKVKVFDAVGLGVVLMGFAENGFNIVDGFEIIQSTNFYAKDRQEVMEGSILHTDKEGNGYVYMEDDGQWEVLFRDETRTLFDILYAPSCELVGHILSNPELLE